MIFAEITFIRPFFALIFFFFTLSYLLNASHSQTLF